MKKEIMAKVSRIKKTYKSVVINVAIYGNGCPQCKKEMPFARPAYSAIACYPEELEQRLDRLQNINIMEFDTNVAANTLFVIIDGVNEVLCDACQPKKIDLGNVIKTGKNGTKEYPNIVLQVPVLGKAVRCQMKDLRRSDGLYTGKLCYYKKVEDGQALVTLDLQWNPKKHDTPLVKEGNKIIQDTDRRTKMQEFVKAAFDVYGRELNRLAESAGLKEHSQETEQQAPVNCDDIEKQYFNN